ncbi:MAG: MaoC family dehydratase [Burkholderiaceae bacterium]
MNHETLRFDTLQVGQSLPALELPPLTRLTLALYCGASGDHNPIHVDSDFAHEAGMPDVFAHGMLSMAWLGRAVTDLVPQSALREFQVRFAAITHVGERIRCTCTVRDKFEHEGERRVRLDLSTANESGVVKLAGEAVIALPQ